MEHHIFIYYNERAKKDEFDALFPSDLELMQRRNREDVETDKNRAFCFSILSVNSVCSKFAHQLKRCSNLFGNEEQPFVWIHLLQRVWNHLLARSSDLTPVACFSWGYAKSIVYQTGPTTLDDRKNRITDTCASVVEQMVEKLVCFNDTFPIATLHWFKIIWK